MDSISATVGNRSIPVEDLKQIKCPICGCTMDIIALEEEPSSKSTNIRAVDSHVDDIGIRHTRFFGEDSVSTPRKIHFSCPENCVERMILNVSITNVGFYRELTELQTHGL